MRASLKLLMVSSAKREISLQLVLEDDLRAIPKPQVYQYFSRITFTILFTNNCSPNKSMEAYKH
ncbi:hypothetical protein K502DRAFT_369162 [Neoconidiobolus thromboides FSU 785]|nr:hypothetical protein K502DRAFT_369162 [Neoconidiobolus thromboides FSU 785]